MAGQKHTSHTLENFYQFFRELFDEFIPKVTYAMQCKQAIDSWNEDMVGPEYSFHG
jgi:hypothetical protein